MNWGFDLDYTIRCLKKNKRDNEFDFCFITPSDSKVSLKRKYMDLVDTDKLSCYNPLKEEEMEEYYEQVQHKTLEEDFKGFSEKDLQLWGASVYQSMQHGS